MSKTSKSIVSLFSRNSCELLSAKLIQQKLKGTNKVTIYRNLDVLVSAGVLRRVRVHEDEFSYELANSHHHHAICTVCSRVEVIDRCEPHVFNKALANVGFSTSYHTLEFFGTCKKCHALAAT